jgi:hypothetical protein
MQVTDIWMIAAYGGGSTVNTTTYYAVEPAHHPEQLPEGFDMLGRDISSYTGVLTPAETRAPSVLAPPPEWSETAARARWLVYHSLWTAVSTVSVRLGGSPWGNVRSIADGVGTDSTGLPISGPRYRSALCTPLGIMRYLNAFVTKVHFREGPIIMESDYEV